ncbi:hypothetical protein PHYBOEH_004691 [Phytophthora boehmeriae]|uniref:Transposase putative helix-turn-helix domain-containing protein n=1 Tax=Phytophthora boehmeriae TaxID=109152 RepID=A0A8T1WS84_9STRA|nr:hypothetical protein PHYBOEH_004691 [Phytophthora boehmeriae]
MDEIAPESDLSDVEDVSRVSRVSRAMASAKPQSRQREDLVHSSEWFRRAIADDLWMPKVTEDVSKPRRPRRRRFRRNFSDEVIHENWRTNSMPSPASVDERGEDEEEDTVSVNSVIKLRLYPTSSQKEKLDQMFASNRAVYNKLVACSREDRLGISSDKKMTQGDLMKKYRPIAVLKSMSKYFRNNKRARARHRQVHDEVRDSAFRDFKKAVKSSLALFFAKKARDEKTTYPDMKFKSKFSPSNTIEIRSRSIKTIDRDEVQLLRFHKTFFGFQKNEGIALHEPFPELTASVRLQRLREGEYYIIVPRLRQFPQPDCKRSCAIDPGVRNFVTVYDPNGRTFSVKDSRAVLKKKKSSRRWTR